MAKSYVYELLVDDVVRYIGMGKGQRVFAHRAAANRINRQISLGREPHGLHVHIQLAAALRAGSTIAHRFVASDLENAEARALEVQLIAAAIGQLWNVHPGGGGASAERMVELWSDPDWRAKQTEALKAVWENPEYRQEMQQLRSDPSFRQKISAAVTARFSDPVERNKQAERTRRTSTSRPELAKNHSDLIKQRWQENHEQYSKLVTAHWSDESHRRRQSEAAKRQWSDPQGRLKLTLAAKKSWTPELRAWRSQKTREQWAAKRAAALAQETPEGAID